MYMSQAGNEKNGGRFLIQETDHEMFKEQENKQVEQSGGEKKQDAQKPFEYVNPRQIQ